MPARSAQFQTLVERQPENELFRFSLAQALVEEARDAEAVPHLRACVARKPDWMVARILLGKLLLKSGQTAEGRRELETALRLAEEQQHEEPAHELRGLLAELKS